MNDPIPRGVLIAVLEASGLLPNEIRAILADIDARLEAES